MLSTVQAYLGLKARMGQVLTIPLKVRLEQVYFQRLSEELERKVQDDAERLELDGIEEVDEDEACEEGGIEIIEEPKKEQWDGKKIRSLISILSRKDRKVADISKLPLLENIEKDDDILTFPSIQDILKTPRKKSGFKRTSTVSSCLWHW